MKESSEFDSSQKDETTERLSPDAPVKDIGNVFRRILHFIESLAEVEVVMLGKIDLSDGFWRMIVEEEVKWKLDYVIKKLPGAPPRLFVPLDLQMGWV